MLEEEKRSLQRKSKMEEIEAERENLQKMMEQSKHMAELNKNLILE